MFDRFPSSRDAAQRDAEELVICLLVDMAVVGLLLIRMLCDEIVPAIGSG
jgi:hypothetical protein